jgi:hypothetical protein
VKLRACPKDTVWACAATAKRARALVAAKSGFAKYGAEGDRSPWQDEAVTSCVLQPTMSLMSPETVVREDGSPVDSRGKGAECHRRALSRHSKTVETIEANVSGPLNG